MQRRAFLQVLAAGATGLALDPEQLLWRPGAKTIFLPSPSTTTITLASGLLRKGDVFTIPGLFAVHPITRQPTQRLQQYVVTGDVVGETVPVALVQPTIEPRRLPRRARAVVPGFAPFAEKTPRSGWVR